jgi:hypothetical protein
MAIFTVTSNAVENVDIMISTSFKAGMALMRDDNGRGVPADSQLLVFKTLEQKAGKFLGFATSDHSAYLNTIIIPDVIGSSYIDNAYNYIRTENNEVAVSKRGLVDNLNEGIPNLYNPSDQNVISRRGLAVYNQPNNIFITDQFKAVLHGDYGLDGLDTVTLNPGDLLTFGGGVNAGKLVKVNVNSFGPELYIVGIVEKYVPSTNLLHFRQASFSLNFGANPSTILALDAGLTVSYPGSGSNWFDLSGNARNFTLTNGPVYSSSNVGLISFDGSDDYALTNYTITSNPITVLVWYNSRSFSSASVTDGLISNYENGLPGFDIRKIGTALHISIAIGAGYVDVNITNNVVDNTWYNIAFTYDGTSLITYTNGTSVNTVVSAGTRLNGNKIVIGTSAYNISARTLSCFVSEVRILNRALTVSELLNYYNTTKSRYGL